MLFFLSFFFLFTDFQFFIILFLKKFYVVSALIHVHAYSSAHLKKNKKKQTLFNLNKMKRKPAGKSLVHNSGGWIHFHVATTVVCMTRKLCQK